MAAEKKPFTRGQIILIYLILVALIAFSGYCVYYTYLLMG